MSVIAKFSWRMLSQRTYIRYGHDVSWVIMQMIKEQVADHNGETRS